MLRDKSVSKRLRLPPTAVIPLALTCVGLITACGASSSSGTSTKSLDVARVERAIEHSIMSQRHLNSKVVCPAKVLQRPGKFACIATTVSPKKPHKEIKTGFLVTIHNSRGYVTYVGK